VALFKRFRWISFGVVVGCGGTLWAQRQARRVVDRMLPGKLADRAGSRARAVGADLRDAFSEGRQAMRDREHELRSQIDRRPAIARHPRREHPSVAHDHPSLSAPHLHLVDDGPLAAEDPSTRR
jgi:hypothetical protein